MAPPLGLLGPPELHQPNPSINLPTIPITTNEENPPLGKDQNQSSTPPLNPCLEFFFRATTYPDAPPETPPKYRYSYWPPPKDLTCYEEEAWKLDPITTLKLIFCLRMLWRPNKEAFYKALLWVHKNHPLTLSLNVMVFGDLGWFKELLGILYRVLQDSIDEEVKKKKERETEYRWRKGWEEEESDDEDEKKEEAIITDIRIAKAKSAVERYQNDPEYRHLHDRISELFAEFLTSDLKFLESGEIQSISLASKLCPSIDSSYDKATLICESIARRVFPHHAYAEYKDVEEAHYAYRVRARLWKQVLKPLRKALESSAARKIVKYSSSQNRKALSALEIYRNIFRPEVQGGDDKKLQFELYMQIVNMLLPKKNVVDMVGSLCLSDGLKLPHEIVASLEKKEQGCDKIAELEWRRLVHEFSNKGKLSNCVAVCDIPESMRGSRKEKACLAMGLLISELSENPWKGKVFSFSDFPRLHKIEGDSLQSKCEFVRQNIECAEKVDFLKIYNRVLQVALTEKLSKEKMPKRIFVFTYKNFLMASKNNWVGDYKEAWTNYRKRGYATVPEIVFWNLKDPIAEPEAFGSPVKNRNGGIIITGFSNLLLSVFLKGESDSKTCAAQIYSLYGTDVLQVQKVAPKVEDVMKSAVLIEEFKNLLVLD